MLPNALRLLGLLAGGLLCGLLAGVVARKPRAGLVELSLFLLLATSSIWYWSNAAEFVVVYATTGGSDPARRLFHVLSITAAAFIPALLVQFTRDNAVAHGLRGIPAGRLLAISFWLLVPAAWLWLRDEHRDRYMIVLGGAIALAAFYSFRSGNRESARATDRRFSIAFSIALLISALGLLADTESATFVWASLIPLLCFTRFVYKYNLLGLLIRRRMLFALRLGLVLAFYLFVVRRLTGFLEDEFRAFGAFLEPLFIFGAALIWIPVFGWIDRFLTRSTRLYDRFSRRLIEEAARILNLRQRVQFLAEEVGRTFDFPRVVVAATGEPRAVGRFGEVPADPPLAELEAIVRPRRADLHHADVTRDKELRTLLHSCGFRYVFPLWYENELSGLLLVDPAPRIFVDDSEPLLVNLGRQISHSIETCRVIEENLSLERHSANQEHLAALGRFAATIAHDVRNPLSSIKTIAQVMREDTALRDTYGRDLAFIIAQTDRLNAAVQQLLRFSRPAKDEKPAQVLVLGPMLEPELRVMARQAAESGVTLQWHIQENAAISGEPDMLQAVVSNVLLNAIQASTSGEAVRVSIARDNESVGIAVTDQGPGIPVELRDKVFEPFFTTKQQGTGLGLAIVHNNLRQMNGTIDIVSPVEDGRGTRVVLTFPAA